MMQLGNTGTRLLSIPMCVAGRHVDDADVDEHCREAATVSEHIAACRVASSVAAPIVEAPGETN